MGIFSRWNVKPSPEEERKRKAEICCAFFDREYRSTQEKIQELLKENDVKGVKFAKRRVSAWNVLDEFLTKFLIQWDKNYGPAGSVLSNWEFYADVLYYSGYYPISNVIIKIRVEEILDNVQWQHNYAKNGGFLLMMPDTTLESSRRYRGMLSANSFSTTMGWDWSNSNESERNFIDNELATLVGDSMTAIFDMYGLNNESAVAGSFAAAVLNYWDSCAERQQLKV